jgi:hypothetical protein
MSESPDWVGEPDADNDEECPPAFTEQTSWEPEGEDEEE